MDTGDSIRRGRGGWSDFIHTFSAEGGTKWSFISTLPFEIYVMVWYIGIG
jgi:hypothetical protein